MPVGGSYHNNHRRIPPPSKRTVQSDDSWESSSSDEEKSDFPSRGTRRPVPKSQEVTKPSVNASTKIAPPPSQPKVTSPSDLAAPEVPVNFYLQFQITYKVPKNKNFVICVAGSHHVLGRVDLTMDRFWVRLEKTIKKNWIKEKERRTQRDIEELENLGVDERRAAEQFDMVHFFKKFFLVLEEDIVGDFENFWTSEHHAISGEVGQEVSFAYFIWDLDRFTMWEYEEFPCYRSITVPAVGNAKEYWSYRARTLQDKRAELVRSSGFSDDEGDSDDSDY